MHRFSPMDIHEPLSQTEDEYLFGWDPTPGIVSVWANREGQAIIWRREGDHIISSRERFRPWLFATSLQDLAQVGSRLVPDFESTGDATTFTYRELHGPTESYRYLISATNGRSLERALVDGASHRLGRQINAINELPDEYYRVGPVEQFLMQSGKVYFRGLNYSDLHRLQFDLETTALDPHRGRIFMVAIRDNHGLATIIEAPAPEDETRLISRLCALIRERDPDVIENHNLFGFDLPFLEQRASVLGISLIFGREGGSQHLERRAETLAIGPEARRRTRYSVVGRELIDTLDAVRRHDFVVRDMPSYSLKDVAKYFGIAAPNRVYLDGATIFETYQRDPSRVRDYALDDVAEVDELSQRLLGAPFALASMAPRRFERLASAGPAMGILEPMLVRAYLRNSAALPCQSANQYSSHGMHEGGAVQLLAEGVAEHVVKADVASLYPSLMRRYQIGPACDHLGVFLSILARLTDLRLSLKAAAKQATPGSLEANTHEATQAAMKILINAAYGYMGAGSMALFADMNAADEVTKRGRELLSKVVNSLQNRGMALIEADTDGVYFAVPSTWDEEQERILVAEVGAELPEGIRLEYEGRYSAMLSHEVKNYALLTYSGQLIVRGVALRSSRAEPFGERFLRQALLCTLTNNIPGVRQAFLDTVAALHDRSLPATDLGTRVRLTKTPEAYLASRVSHPEPQYEALLAAGRARWYPGERVRYYRTRNKTYVWLPDANEDASVDRGWESESTIQVSDRAIHEIQDLSTQKNDSLSPRAAFADRRDYDAKHYIQVLITSYAARLRKAFSPGDFEQLFRLESQPGLFDQPVENIQPRWIRCLTSQE
jgi:DNA polymerase I